MRTLPEHLSSPLVCSEISVARSLVFCVMFCRSLFVFLSLSFGHCIVFSSSIYGLAWSLCCSIFSFLCSVLQIVVCLFVPFLLAIVLSVLLRFADSDYLVGIFKNVLVYICIYAAMYYCAIKYGFVLLNIQFSV